MESHNKMGNWHKDYNASSLDGLTGLKFARKMQGQWLLVEDVKVWFRRVISQWDAVIFGVLLALGLTSIARFFGMLRC